MVEINAYKQIETVENEGDPTKIWGISSAKSMRGAFQGKISHFMKFPNAKYSGKDLEMTLRGLMALYDKFHPEVKVPIEIKGWKGKSGFEVIKFPDYFEVIEWRKPDPNSEPKRISNKVSLVDLNAFIGVLKALGFNKTYQTKEIAMEWAKLNKIWENAHGKKIFDSDGFDYSRISGCRTTFMSLYYPLKVCEFYGLVEYGKTGTIKRISQDLDIPTIFT